MGFFPAPTHWCSPTSQGKLFPPLPCILGGSTAALAAAGPGPELCLQGQMGPVALQHLSSVMLGGSFHAPHQPPSSNMK